MKNLVHNFLRAWKFPRWRWALLIAVVSDALGFGVVLMPPVQWLLDAVIAAVLFAALTIEVIPAIQLFPAWTLVVAEGMNFQFGK